MLAGFPVVPQTQLATQPIQVALAPSVSAERTTPLMPRFDAAMAKAMTVATPAILAGSPVAQTATVQPANAVPDALPLLQSDQSAGAAPAAMPDVMVMRKADAAVSHVLVHTAISSLTNTSAITESNGTAASLPDGPSWFKMQVSSAAANQSTGQAPSMGETAASRTSTLATLLSTVATAALNAKPDIAPLAQLPNRAQASTVQLELPPAVAVPALPVSPRVDTVTAIVMADGTQLIRVASYQGNPTHGPTTSSAAIVARLPPTPTNSSVLKNPPADIFAKATTETDGLDQPRLPPVRQPTVGRAIAGASIAAMPGANNRLPTVTRQVVQVASRTAADPVPAASTTGPRPPLRPLPSDPSAETAPAVRQAGAVPVPAVPAMKKQGEGFIAQAQSTSSSRQVIAVPLVDPIDRRLLVRTAPSSPIEPADAPSAVHILAPPLVLLTPDKNAIGARSPALEQTQVRPAQLTSDVPAPVSWEPAASDTLQMPTSSRPQSAQANVAVSTLPEPDVANNHASGRLPPLPTASSISTEPADAPNVGHKLPPTPALRTPDQNAIGAGSRAFEQGQARSNPLTSAAPAPVSWQPAATNTSQMPMSSHPPSAQTDAAVTTLQRAGTNHARGRLPLARTAPSSPTESVDAPGAGHKLPSTPALFTPDQSAAGAGSQAFQQGHAGSILPTSAAPVPISWGPAASDASQTAKGSRPQSVHTNVAASPLPDVGRNQAPPVVAATQSDQVSTLPKQPVANLSPVPTMNAFEMTPMLSLSPAAARDGIASTPAFSSTAVVDGRTTSYTDQLRPQQPTQREALAAPVASAASATASLAANPEIIQAAPPYAPTAFSPTPQTAAASVQTRTAAAGNSSASVRKTPGDAQTLSAAISPDESKSTLLADQAPASDNARNSVPAVEAAQALSQVAMALSPSLHPANTTPVMAAPPGSAANQPTLPQVASPAAQVAPALIAMAHAPDGAQRLTLRLDPLDLGQVQIRIDRPQDAPARVEITVQRQETLTLLLRDQPQLQTALNQAGVPQDGRTITFHLAAAEPAPRADTAAMQITGAGGAGHAGGNGSDAASRQGNNTRQASADSMDDFDADLTPVAVPTWLRAGLDITA